MRGIYISAFKKSCFKVYKKNGRPSEFYHTGGYRPAHSFYLHFRCSASFWTLSGNSALLSKSILLTYLQYLEFINVKSYKNHITMKKISYIMKTNHFEIMYFFVDKKKWKMIKSRSHLTFTDLNCKASAEFEKEAWKKVNWVIKRSVILTQLFGSRRTLFLWRSLRRNKIYHIRLSAVFYMAGSTWHVTTSLT